MFKQFPKNSKNRWLPQSQTDSIICFETICFETMCFENGVLANVNYHQARYQFTLDNYFSKQLSLDNIICFDIFNEFKKYLKINNLSFKEGLFRVKFSYNHNNFKFEIFPYQRKSFKTFKPVIIENFAYDFKFYDRSYLDQLRHSQTDCDEIIMVKNGLITDCSIGNLVFMKNKQYFTPQKPLLAGTMRAYLLEQKIINPLDIKLADLDEFEQIIVINALNPLKVLKI